MVDVTSHALSFMRTLIIIYVFLFYLAGVICLDALSIYCTYPKVCKYQIRLKIYHFPVGLGGAS